MGGRGSSSGRGAIGGRGGANKVPGGGAGGGTLGGGAGGTTGGLAGLKGFQTVGGRLTAPTNANSPVGGSPPQPSTGRFERPSGPLDKDYREVLERRYESGDAEAKRVYDKYIPHGGKVINGAYTGVAHYSPARDAVEMDFDEDANPPEKHKGTIWYHEHGHLVDQHAGIPSSDPAFYDAIHQDIIAYEDRWLQSHGRTRDDMTQAELARAIGSEMVRKGNGNTHFVQDIYGGVIREYNAHERGTATEYGHKWADYWLRRDQREEVSSEAWAHMFDAAFNLSKAPIVNEYFPNAWTWFNNKLKGL